MTLDLRALFNLRRGEAAPVLLAALFFFCVLTALMVLRPAREALGMRRGIDSVRWLFLATALATLLCNPLFAALVARFRRLWFITATYAFFAASLLGFHALLVFAPASIGITSGQVFYVWFSVFNLFATMVFWALMADSFVLEQSRRFFALIAVGGTLGAIAGPALAGALAGPLGTPALLLVAVGFLALAVIAAWGLMRVQARMRAAAVNAAASAGDGRDAAAAPTTTVIDAGGAAAVAPAAAGVDASRRSPAVAAVAASARVDHHDLDHARIGGSAWAGFKAVFQSRYLAGVAGYIVLMTVLGTFLYFTRLQMVAALGENLDARTALFARIDLITQGATLLLQAVVVGRLMQRIGVAATLALLPLTVALGFIGLAIVGSLAALIAFESVFRAVQRALARPARETLYTVVSRSDKYKSKAFIDTFVHRGGDVAGAQVEGWLARLGLGLAALSAVAVPLALAWAVLGWWLGRQQQRLANLDGPRTL